MGGQFTLYINIPTIIIKFERAKKYICLLYAFIYSSLMNRLFVLCLCYKIIEQYVSTFAILVNKNTSDGFGLVEWENEFETVVVVVVVVVAEVGRFTICGRVETIGFFVGFGFGWDGSFSQCVGLGFVIKFGWVVTCHCVVCASWFHKPNFD